MFESALAEGESGQVLGEALYLGREYVAAVAHHERAYVAYRRERQSMAAGRAAERLDRVARAQRGPYLRAVPALARGRVGVAGGRATPAACCIRRWPGSPRPSCRWSWPAPAWS